jgi:hypothetical protein
MLMRSPPSRRRHSLSGRLLAIAVLIALSLVQGAEAQRPRDDRPAWEDPPEQLEERPSSGSSPRLRTYGFHSVRRAAPLPGSRGVALCALTAVDDDTRDGWCKVFFDENAGEWMHQTGGGASDNYCEATCLWLGPNDSDDALAQPRLRLRESRNDAPARPPPPAGGRGSARARWGGCLRPRRAR